MIRKLIFTSLLFCYAVLAQAQNETADRINRLNEEAFAALDLYDYRQAINLEFSCLEILHNSDLADDTMEVQLMANIGSFYQLYQVYDSAVFYLEKSLKYCASKLGEGNEVYVGVALQLGGLYEAILDYPAADKLNKKTILVAKKIGLENSMDYAYLLNNQSIVKHKLGQEIAALELVNECLALTENLSGKKSLDYANSLNAKSMIFLGMGKIPQATAALDEAENICHAVKGKQTSTYASILGNRGVLLSETGENKNALTFHQKSLEIKTLIFGEKSLEVAVIYSNMATANGAIGNVKAALSLYDKSIKITQELLGKTNPDVYQRKSMKAWYLYQSGSVKEAGDMYAEMLNELRDQYGLISPEYLGVASNAALFYSATEQYDKADQYFSILYTNKTLLDNYSRRTFENNYASYLHSLGKDPEAEKIYLALNREIEKDLGKEHPEYALNLQNLAVFYQDGGKLDTAIILLKEAGDIARKLSGTENSVYLSASENLGEIYYTRGDYPATLRIMKELADVKSKNIGKNNLEYAHYLSRIAMCYTNMDKVDEGLAYLEEAYAIKTSLLGEKDPKLAYETTLLATAYTYRRDFVKGNEYFEKTKQLTVNQFNTYFRFMTEDEKLKFLQKNITNLKQLQSIAIDISKENPQLLGMVMDIEMLTKGMILESGSKLKNKARNSSDPAIQSAYKEWNEVNLTLANEMLKPKENRREDLAEFQKKALELEKKLVTRLGNEGALDINEINWKSIAARLEAGEALVEFITFKPLLNPEETRYAAVILKKGMAQPFVQVLMSEKELKAFMDSRKTNNNQNTALALYSRGAGAVNEETIPEPADFTLYNFIWAPIKDQLQGVGKVYYSPAGVLYKISLSALPVPGSGFLSDQHSLVCLSGSRMLMENVAPFQVENAFVAGGINYQTDPEKIVTGSDNGGEARVYASPGNKASPWHYLDGTKKESEGLNAFFTSKALRTTYLTGDSAYEEKVKGVFVSQQPSIIHIATHGYFFPTPEKSINPEEVSAFRLADNPMLRSGLILTGANYAWTGTKTIAGRDDGILTAFEVAHMDLSQTRLVVLSACETGLGDIQGSEGVFGLQRAFKQAGAQYVVMSLWQVPDKETVEFMNLFYQGLLSGVTIEKSFTDAQDVMKKKYEPYYWAAFVLVR